MLILLGLLFGALYATVLHEKQVSLILAHLRHLSPVQIAIFEVEVVATLADGLIEHGSVVSSVRLALFVLIVKDAGINWTA